MSSSRYLQVSKLHKIQFEEHGNPRGKPLVFLPGGRESSEGAEFSTLGRPAFPISATYSENGERRVLRSVPFVVMM